MIASALCIHCKSKPCVAAVLVPIQLSCLHLVRNGSTPKTSFCLRVGCQWVLAGCGVNVNANRVCTRFLATPISAAIAASSLTTLLCARCATAPRGRWRQVRRKCAAEFSTWSLALRDNLCLFCDRPTLAPRCVARTTPRWKVSLLQSLRFNLISADLP
jgi:hypothetical protein